MKNNIFTVDEILAKLQISAENFQKWEKQKLIGSIGLTDEGNPIYSDETIVNIEQIKKLSELGYGDDEIQKIIKKVGLPKQKPKDTDVRGRKKFLTVGNLAEQAGISPRTIKHWEDKGIIEADMRSEGGFRLYDEIYVYLCKLIRDLQLFGYSLEEIKTISDYFRDFLYVQDNPDKHTVAVTAAKLDDMLRAIDALFEKMNLFKDGIQRWEDLLKKKRKEIVALRNQNKKRTPRQKEDKGA